MAKKTKSADKNNPPAKKSAKDKVKAAADKAEAAAAAKAAKDKAAAEKAAAKEAKTAAKVKKIDFNSPMNEDEQRLFLSHLPIIQAQQAKLATANSDLRNLYKKAKADGFEKVDFDIAMAIDTAEKEAKAKAKIARQLTIAKYCGKALGAQLDLFLEPERTPVSESAYEEGKIASMKNEPAKPSYDPSTEQHREYMRGYHEVQEKQVKAGITKPEPEKTEAPRPAPTVLISKATKDEQAAAKQQAPAPSVPKAAPVPHSGMGMSRADYLAQKNKAREEAEKLFRPSTTVDNSAEKPEPEFQSAFKKKAVPA